MTHNQESERIVPGLGYRLVVPDGWFTLDLDSERRERSVRALVERQFTGIDNAPHLKTQAQQGLLAKAEAAYATGALDMFLSLQEIAGIPLAASLVVFLVPAPEDGHTTDAGQLARALRGEDREVLVTDLPAGRSVRVLRRSGSDGSDPGADATTLEVFVPAKDSGAWLLLSFSAPLGPLAPAMIKLFDAICTTLRWDQ